MPRGRCRFYDEQGHPINGGCTRQGFACDFIHPSELAWATASAPIPRKSTQPNLFIPSNRGREGGKGRGAGPRRSGANEGSSADGGWPTSGSKGTSAGSGWTNASTWGASSKSGKDKESEDSVWGDAWKDTSTGNEGGGDAGGSGSTWGGGGGWGGGGAWTTGGGRTDSADKPSGSGQGDSNHKDKDKPAADGGGWGSGGGWDSGGGWGASDTTTTGWGNSTSGNTTQGGWSGWSDPNTLQDAGATATAAESSKVKVPDKTSSRGGQTSQISASPTKGSQKDSSSAPEKWRRIDDNHRESARDNNSHRNNDDTAMDDWSRVTEAASAAPPAARRAASPSGTEVTTSTARVPKFKSRFPVTSAEKREVWSESVKLLCEAVQAEMDLRVAESNRDRWRQTQKSIHYQSIGLAGREKLDNNRAVLNAEVNDRKKIQSDIITTIMHHPHMSNGSLPDFNLKKVSEDIKLYTDETKEWIEELRPLLERITEQASKKMLLKDSQPDVDDDPPSKRRRLYSSQGDSDMALSAELSLFSHRLDTFDERISNLEDIPIAKYTNILDSVDETVESKRIPQLLTKRSSPLEEGEVNLPTQPIVPDVVDQLSMKVDALGEKVAGEVGRVTDVLTRNPEIEGRLKELNAENKALKEQLPSLQLRLAEMDAKFQNQAELKREMHEKLKTVLTRPNSLPPTFVSDRLVEHLTPVVQGVVSNDMNAVLGSLHAAYSSQISLHHQEIYGRVWDQLQPALKIVERVQQWMQTTGSAE